LQEHCGEISFALFVCFCGQPEIIMSTAHQIVVCGSIVPDPLHTLEPVASPAGAGGLHSAEN
jgi:hypothetical protein